MIKSQDSRRRTLLHLSIKRFFRLTMQVRQKSCVYMLVVVLMPFSENQEISDYLQEGDAGFKKPKKRKKQRATRQAEESEIAHEVKDEMDLDEPSASSRPAARDLETNFVDDEELQAALARSRRAKMKKMPKLKPEEIARRGMLFVPLSEQTIGLTWVP